MKKHIYLLTLLIFSCASPQAFDIVPEATNIQDTHGIIIGKAENWGSSGMQSTGWTSYAAMAMGISTKVSIVYNGVKSAYGVEDEGYYILKVPAGEVTDLYFQAEFSAQNNSSSATYGNVTISSSAASEGATAYPLASVENPVQVEAGKVTIIPTHYFRTLLGIGLEYQKTDDEGAKNAEIIQWYRSKFPGLANTYPAPEI